MYDPYTMVAQSRPFGGGLDIGSLVGKIMTEAGGVPANVPPIRNAVQPFISPGESAALDQLLTDMGMLGTSTPAPTPTPTPTPTSTPILVLPISTTPSDANGLIFPAADASQEEKIAFYTSQAYYDYMTAHAAATAPYAGGIDQLFDNYTLNGVLSFEAQQNLYGATTYMQQIDQLHRAELTSSVQQRFAEQGYQLTAAETQFLLGGGSITMVPSVDNPSVLVSVDYALDPNAILVTAPTAAIPSSYSLAGVLTMSTQGMLYLPGAIGNGQATSGPQPDFRPLNTNEKAMISRIFGNSVDMNKVSLVFGDGHNAVAQIAFQNGHNAITWGNYIYLNMTPRDMTATSSDFAILAHEMRHIVQYQTWGFVFVTSTISAQAIYYGGNEAYRYFTRSNSFANETLEGQAQIVQDYVKYREYNTLPTYTVNGTIYNVTAQQLEQWAVGSGIYGK